MRDHLVLCHSILFAIISLGYVDPVHGFNLMGNYLRLYVEHTEELVFGGAQSIPSGFLQSLRKDSNKIYVMFISDKGL